jgi:vacuolar iron transporter family protein
MNKKTLKVLRGLQRSEITEFHVYQQLAKIEKHKKNKVLLRSIAKDEYRHYKVWKAATKKHVKPSLFMVYFYVFMARVFGIIFTLALMERRGSRLCKKYMRFSSRVKGVKGIIRDEKRHENSLIKGYHEEKLHYVSSIVLGLNDALVEITGMLAGLTFALQNNALIALVGLITGIAAALSMASSEYLSMKHEKGKRNPISAAFYTGVAYFVVVILLVVPYFVLNNVYFSLLWTVLNALLVIFLFSFYVSVAKGESFVEKFSEMAMISLGVALFSFLVGVVVRLFFGIDV